MSQPRKPDEKVNNVQSKLSQAQSVMRDNIELVLNRGENLQNISNQSDALHQSATQFTAAASMVRDDVFLQRIRLYIVAGMVVLAVILIICLYKNPGLLCGLLVVEFLCAAGALYYIKLRRERLAGGQQEIPSVGSIPTPYVRQDDEGPSGAGTFQRSNVRMPRV